MKKVKLILITVLALAMTMAFATAVSFADPGYGYDDPDKIDLNDCIIVWDNYVEFNDGNPVEPEVHVSYSDGEFAQEFEKDVDYEIICSNNTAVTEQGASIIFRALPDSEYLTGEASGDNYVYWLQYPLGKYTTITLDKTSFPVKIEKNDSGKLDAVAQTPTVSVTHNGTDLEENIDYTVQYLNSNSKNVGTYTVTITAVDGGKYSGTVSKDYKITACSMSKNVKVTLSKTSYPVKFKKNNEWKVQTVVQKPSVKSVTYNGINLNKSDYTVKFGNSKSKNAGTYSVTVSAKAGSNFTGSKKVTYTIKAMNINNNFYPTARDYYYTGKYIKPKTVRISYYKDSTGLGMDLVKDTHYTVTKAARFSQNKKIGWAQIKITIKGKGNFTGTKTVYGCFTIGPYKAPIVSLTAGKNKMTVKWKKSSNASGYIINYSGYNPNTGKTTAWKEITVSSKSTVSKTIKNLKSGYYYDVWVHSYKKVDGEKVYKWNDTYKTVKVK